MKNEYLRNPAHCEIAKHAKKQKNRRELGVGAPAGFFLCCPFEIGHKLFQFQQVEFSIVIGIVVAENLFFLVEVSLIANVVLFGYQ